jgi:uncharacterized protein YndB with AHSA1/START domain
MNATTHSATVELPGDTQILITREFAAPRHLVWRAWTEPELIARWWAGERGRVTSVEVDLRVGGRWRYAMATDDGSEVGFHGEYREIAAPGRMVSTEVYEGVPDSEAVNTLTLTEHGGRTVLTVLVEHTSRENRDGHVESGMEGGLQEALDALERVAVELGG